MITFSEIAQLLENRLNGNDFENIQQYGLDGITNPQTALIPNERYAFKIFTDTGVYKKAERMANTVTRYINGTMSVVGNTVEGLNASNFTAVVQTKVDFIIPFAEGANETSRNSILNAVRQLMTAALQYTDEGEFIDYEDVSYLYIINYMFANSGTRGQANEAGDSFTLSVLINHSFVAQGVASSKYKFEILSGHYYNPIPYQKYGVVRKCTFDTNTDHTLEAKSIATSSALTISFDLIKRVSAFDEAIDDFIFSRKLTPLTIRITKDSTSHVYVMNIDTAGLNGAVGAVASSSVTLVSAQTFEED